VTRHSGRLPVRILATGTTGFLGRHILRALVAGGHRVTRMGRDLRDPATFPADVFDLVLHAAAMVDKKHWQGPDLFEVNVEGTRRLLDAYPDAKMVFLSSADVERDTLTPYALSKREAEDLVLARNPSHLAVRPPSVFGPGDTHDKLVPRLFAKYLRGAPMTLSEGMNELVEVEDLARQVAAGLDRAGVWRIRGRLISNVDLDRLVAAFCRGESSDGLDENALYFYRGLQSIRDAMEVDR
jgi:nucleoside-diphosphate-sugar epimerase